MLEVCIPGYCKFTSTFQVLYSSVPGYWPTLSVVWLQVKTKANGSSVDADIVTAVKICASLSSVNNKLYYCIFKPFIEKPPHSQPTIPARKTMADIVAFLVLFWDWRVTCTLSRRECTCWTCQVQGMKRCSFTFQHGCFPRLCTVSWSNVGINCESWNLHTRKWKTTIG